MGETDLKDEDSFDNKISLAHESFIKDWIQL